MRGTRNDIFVMNADGSGQTNLTNIKGNDFWPDWSPLGDKILFGSERDGNGEIYVINTDGSGQTNLSNSAAEEYLAGLASDASKIVLPATTAGPATSGSWTLTEAIRRA